MNPDIDRLTNNQLFENVSYETLEEFLTLADPRTVESGTEIISEGENERGFHLIQSGRVHVLKEDIENIENDPDIDSIYVTTLEDGESFGEMSLFTDNTVSASVVARSESDLLFFPREKLESFFDDYPEFGFQFILNVKNLIAERTRSTTDSLTELKASNNTADPQELEELLEELDYYSYL